MKIAIIAYTVFIWLIFLLICQGMQYRLIEKKPVVKADAIFEIKKGESFDTIVKHLRETGFDINPFWLKWYAFRENLAKHLKAGEYDLKKSASSADILALFVSGKTHKYAITFPEGWSFKQVFQEIQNNPYLQHTLINNEFADLLKYIGTDKTHPEGLFFPDTYFFERHTQDIELLKRAHDKMLNILNEEWRIRDSELPLQSPYQALILASIIEKETAANDERKAIAGVFIRRLKKGMLLQTDPTVIYGLGDEYHGDLHYKDLKQVSPYNTYIIQGLPPTPIAMPGKNSIIAALHPENHNFLYFVSNGDGHHIFSATLQEHEKNVLHYQK
jgi:UPF0755 protein